MRHIEISKLQGIANQLYSQLGINGGVTINIETGAVVDKGFAVGIINGPVYENLQDVNVGEILGFLHDYQEEGYVGSWQNPETGIIYIDISEVYETKEEAAIVALLTTESAIYDIEKGETIFV